MGHLFPISGIQKVGEVLCFMLTIGTAYFDSYGIVYVKTEDALGTEMLKLVWKFCEALKIGNWSTTIKHRQESFTIQAHMCHGFVYHVIECCIKQLGLRDGDYGKVGILHTRKMLL